jgi:hypothetical protein
MVRIRDSLSPQIDLDSLIVLLLKPWMKPQASNINYSTKLYSVPVGQ